MAAEKIRDYSEIENIILSMMPEPHTTIHIWDILKLAQKKNISERATRRALDYFKNKKLINVDKRNSNVLYLTKTGVTYRNNIGEKR